MDTYTQRAQRQFEKSPRFEILNGQVKETFSITTPLSANAELDA